MRLCWKIFIVDSTETQSFCCSILDLKMQYYMIIFFFQEIDRYNSKFQYFEISFSQRKRLSLTL